MRKDTFWEATEFLAGKRRRRTWKKIASALGCIVVFCTAYALILPAITMEEAPQCGKPEHTHSEACYVPVTTETKTVLACTPESLGLHQHTDACLDENGEYCCGYSDFVVHEHNDSCFDENGNLVCPLPEIKAHTHDESCYAQDRILIGELSTESMEDEQQLICDKAEIILHEHNSDCFDQDGNLICGEQQVLEHAHQSNCFQTVEVPTDTQTLTCTIPEGEGAHTHSVEAGCYDESGNLICQMEESEGHRHGTLCYGTWILTCHLEEHVHDSSCFAETALEETEPAEEASNAETTDVSIPFRGEASAEAYLLPPERADPGAENAMVKMPAEAGPETGFETASAVPEKDSLTESDPDPNPPAKPDLGKYLTSVAIQRREKGEELWQDIADGNVRVDDELRFDIHYELPVGTLDANRHVVIYQVPDPIKITKGDSGDVLDGEKKVVGTYTIGLDGKIEITFNQTYAEGNASGSAIVGHIAFESSVEAIGGKAGEDIVIPFQEDCTLHVKNASGDLRVEKVSKNVVASDGTLDYEITISSEHGTGEKVILEDVMENVAMVKDTLTVKDASGNDVEYAALEDGRYELPQMNGGDQYILSYSAKTTSTPSVSSLMIAANTVKVSSTDSAKVPVTDEATTTDVFTKKLMVKSGVLSEDGKTISWTIRLNYGTVKVSENPDMYERVDISGWTLKDVMNGQEYTGEVTISPDPNTGSGTLTTHLPYTFPENSSKVEYNVTYTTDGTKDTANTAALSPPKEGTGVDVTVKPGEFTVSKEGKGWSLLEVRDAGGNQLVKADWTVTVDATDCAIPADMTDWLPGRSSASAWPDGGYWYLRERVYGSNYFTPEQLTQAAEEIAAAIGKTTYCGGYYIFACVSAISNVADTILIKQGGQFQTGFELWDAGNTYANGAPSRDINDGVNRNVIYVFFDSPLGPSESFEFNCSMVANVGAGAANTNIYNNVQIFTKSVKPEVTEIQLFTPVIKKYDMYGGHTGTPGVPSSHTTDDVHQWYTYSNLSYSDVLAWKIQINFPKDKTYDEDVVITETLPDGIKLLALDSVNSKTGERAPNGTFGLYASFVTAPEKYVFKGTRCYFDGSGEHNYDSVTVDGEKIVNGRLNSPDMNTCYETWGGYTVTYKKLSERQYQITVPKELANQLVGCEGSVIYIWAQLEDPTGWAGIEESFQNTVNIYTGKEKMGEASQEQTIKRKVISKSSTGYDKNRKTIGYTVTINADGRDLVKGSDTLTLTDVLSFAPPADGSVTAMLNGSIQVTNTRTGEDITSQCSYTVVEGASEDGKEVTSTITVNKLPDSSPLKVEYTYKMSGWGEVTDFKNTATIEGTGSDSTNSGEPIEIAVQQGNADAHFVGINVYKVNGHNRIVYLDGAQFELYVWSGTEWKLFRSYETATDANGNKGTFNTGNLNANTAYRLIETGVPEGYDPNRTSQYEFYILDRSEDAPPDCKPVNFQGKCLDMGDSITINNYPSGYELPETGGDGTILYTTGGLLLITASILLLYSNPKRRKEDFASS